MKIETKFNLKDKVYPIRRGGYSDFVECKTCAGTGVVKINNTDRCITCPDCMGFKGERCWVNDKWFVATDSIGIIGNVRTEIYDKKFKEKDKIAYMLDSTGVGSGTIWYEEHLFSTHKEALEVCKNLNK